MTAAQTSLLAVEALVSHDAGQAALPGDVSGKDSALEEAGH